MAMLKDVRNSNRIQKHESAFIRTSLITSMEIGIIDGNPARLYERTAVGKANVKGRHIFYFKKDINNNRLGVQRSFQFPKGHYPYYY